MQLARELFLTREKTWKRKIEEAFLAVELEKTLSKQQILTLYCNLAFLGHGNYGMEAAARDYFGHGVARAHAARGGGARRHRPAAERIQPAAQPDQGRRAPRLRAAPDARGGLPRRGRLPRGDRDAAGGRAPTTPGARSRSTSPRRCASSSRRATAPSASTRRVCRSTPRSTARVQRGAEEALRAGLLRLDHRKGWRGPIGARRQLLATGDGDRRARRAQSGPRPLGARPGARRRRRRRRAIRLPDREVRGRPRRHRLDRPPHARRGPAPGRRRLVPLRPGRSRGQAGASGWSSRSPLIEGAVVVLESASGAVRAWSAAGTSSATSSIA